MSSSLESQRSIIITIRDGEGLSQELSSKDLYLEFGLELMGLGALRPEL